MPSYQYDGTKWILATGGGTVTSVATTGSLTGGTITTSGTLQLVNDATSPGNSKYYGTDSGGTKGFFTLPGAITPAALTKTDDTNVTLTLGGTPATALLQATSLTLGWTGLLSLARGGTNANLTASNGGIFYSTASAGAILSGTATANKVLMSGSSTAPVWSTPTYPNASATAGKVIRSDGTNFAASTFTIPDTYAQGDIIYASATSVFSALAKNTSATRYLSNTGTSNNPAWAQVNLANGVTGSLPWANIVTPTSDGSLTISGALSIIINTAHTNVWTIYQSYTESSHSSATAGEWWNDSQQHSMAFNLSGSSTDNAIKVWPTGCFYSMYDQVVTTGSGEQEMMVQL